MTDKEKVRKEIQRLQDLTMDENKNFYSEAAEGEYNALCNIEHFIDSLQEEPVRKVWHDSNKEQPKCGSNVVIWSPTLETGELITKCAKVFENRIWAYLDDLIYIQYD